MAALIWEAAGPKRAPKVQAAHAAALSDGLWVAAIDGTSTPRPYPMAKALPDGRPFSPALTRHPSVRVPWSVGYMGALSLLHPSVLRGATPRSTPPPIYPTYIGQTSMARTRRQGGVGVGCNAPQHAAPVSSHALGIHPPLPFTVPYPPPVQSPAHLHEPRHVRLEPEVVGRVQEHVAPRHPPAAHRSPPPPAPTT